MPGSENRATDYLAWVVRANQDLLNIKNNLDAEEIPWNTVVFHAQQAAEKYFKALILARGLMPERTHSLPVLLAECLPFDSTLIDLRDDCQLLNRHASRARYPDGSAEIQEPLARVALEASARICSKIQTLLPAQENP